MNCRTVLALLVSAMAGLAGCKDLGSEPLSIPPTPKGGYVYSAFDSNSAPIARGWFTIVLSDTGTVSGEWHIQSIANRGDIGPQSGDGQLTGALFDTTLHVNLNPGWADNNVLLTGRFDTASYHGSWVWATIVGISNRGTFEAVKN